MTPDRFVEKCPSLWHVAPAGAWDRIGREGFCTAEQLIRRADLDEWRLTELLRKPRRESVRLVVEGQEVVLRDQGPLFKKADLASILDDGLTVADWIHVLNSRVYLFAHKDDMTTLLEKYVGRDGAQDLITISPWRLLNHAGPRIELSAQNAGAIAHRMGTQKGRDTFVSITRFPDRRPVEVTIVDGLDDLSPVVRAERHYADGRREVLPLP
jgi:hypothetical protein